MKKNNLTIISKAMKCFILLLLSFAITGKTLSQAKDSKGLDFWLTFPGNYDGAGQLPTSAFFFITGEENANGFVSIPGLAFSVPFSVTSGTITTVDLPNSVFLTISNTVQNNGIHVTSDKEVTVYGLNQQTYTTDAYLALPTDVLGTEYINLGYSNTGLGGTQFGVVASQNSTTATITPSVTTDGHTAGIPYAIALNQGETYQLRNTTGSSPNDLSGTIITSDKPIAVFGSHQCANIPDANTFACDYVVEQLPPTTAWGKNFVTIPLKTRLNGDTYRFLASSDNTVVKLNGVTVATLNRGQYYQSIIAGYNQVTSDKPILVAQYSNGTSYDGVTSDPFMMLIFPFEQFLNNYTVTTPATGFSLNFINIAAPNAAIGAVKLDGVIIPAASFTPIGITGFSGAQLTVNLGAHVLNGTSLPFGVGVYGFADADSYGYPGGGSFSPIATVTSLIISPKTGSGAINTNHCWEALVKDQNNTVVAGVRVDFNIVGPNSASSGSAITNASGIAAFCYAGANAGDDVITALTGTVSDNATFTWTSGCNITLTAKKFYDLNTDGIDNDNIPVQNWPISLSGTDENNNPVGPVNQLTNATGTTGFTPLAKGSYTVSEGSQSGWINTTPTSANVNLTICSDPAPVKFGNVCLGAGSNAGGTGIGFWANKNGQSFITGSYLCELNVLCLRNAIGADFDPVAGCPAPSSGHVNVGKINFKNWLLNVSATNMAYMLSAQLAATKLNVLMGYANGTRLIYAPGTTSANAAGFATVNAVMSEANNLLCANPVINAGNPSRTTAEAIKNALDRANNNLNFVQAQPCTVLAPAAIARSMSQEIISVQQFQVNTKRQLKASPNPTRNFFTLTVESDNYNDKITLRVIDMAGRIIEFHNGLKSGQSLQIGKTLLPGTYLIETIQGKDRKTQTVIKQ